MRIDGGEHVRLRGLTARGYRVGILARDVRDLTLDSNDLSYGWKPRLFSVVEHESLNDWLSYHKNERDEWLRFGAGGRSDDVRFGEQTDRVSRFGGDVTVDTRVDPAFPRNALQATFGINRLQFDGGNARQRRADVTGYVGLFRQIVLAVRGVSITSNNTLPAYEQNLLGGVAYLRGYDAGYKAGDNVAAVSAELRMPVTSPLNIGRLGVKAFVDAGTVYAAGEKLRDQRLIDRGIGGGVYLQMTVVSVSLDVARSRAGNTRFLFGMGVTFN